MDILNVISKESRAIYKNRDGVRTRKKFKFLDEICFVFVFDDIRNNSILFKFEFGQNVSERYSNTLWVGPTRSNVCFLSKLNFYWNLSLIIWNVNKTKFIWKFERKLSEWCFRIKTLRQIVVYSTVWLY